MKHLLQIIGALVMAAWVVVFSTDACAATDNSFELAQQKNDKNISDKQAVSDKDEINWDSVKKAYETYRNEPSPTNAEKVTQLLPEKRIVHNETDARNRADEYIYSNLRILERQVIAADKSSVRLAFRIRNFADGGFLSDLNILLGKLIRINPGMFLEELNRVEYKDYNSILRNLGPEYVDLISAQCYELNQRLKMLNSVTAPDLADLRNESIGIINLFIMRDCGRSK